MKNKNQLTFEKWDMLTSTLKILFSEHPERHSGLDWSQVLARLESAAGEKCWSLLQMEETGGEPDVVRLDDKTGAIVFFDCSPESPKGRRSLCYDRAALESRKEFKPFNSACDMANEMGIELLNEEQYRALQQLGKFDLKTSSWVKTPEKIRELGGALFCDRRYDNVFLYHNGAESYYAARGFRGWMSI
jgi:hypothetical protein